MPHELMPEDWRDQILRLRDELASRLARLPRTDPLELDELADIEARVLGGRISRRLIRDIAA